MGPGEAMAVGYGGLAYHYEAGTWNKIETGVTADLMGVWGPDRDHVWMSGTGGTLLQWTRSGGNSAVPDPTLSVQDDLGAMHGSGNTAWVAAGGAAVLRRTDAGWTRIDTPVAASSIFAIDDDHVVVSSASQSKLARWNGTAFVVEDSGAASPASVLFQPRGGTMFAGGLKTLIAHP
jgi:hypothetical protein